jgi:hypothetical protein
LADADDVSTLQFASDPPVASLTLAGRAFHDLNRNNVFDAVDVPLAGTPLYLDLDLDQQPDSNEPRATPDAAGLYSFAPLDYGSYAVRLVTQAGFGSLQSPFRTLYEDYTAHHLSFRRSLSLVIGEYRFDAATPRVRLIFDAPLAAPASTAAAAFTLTNETTDTVIPSSSIAVALDPVDDRSLIVSYVGSAGQILPDGSYTLTAPATAVRDHGLFGMGQPLAVRFFVFSGDANRDRAINIQDFGILASNFNTPGTFATGDFNYDGVTNIQDFGILASKFNTTLSEPLYRHSASASASAPTRFAARFSTSVVGLASSDRDGKSAFEPVDVLILSSKI